MSSVGRLVGPVGMSVEKCATAGKKYALFMYLLEVKLPYQSVCPSVGRLANQSTCFFHSALYVSYVIRSNKAKNMGDFM